MIISQRSHDRLGLSPTATSGRSRRNAVCVVTLSLAGCTSEPLQRQFETVKGLTEAVVRLQADANQTNRRVFRDARVRSALADLDAVHAELLVDLGHSSVRRMEDCEGIVAAALGNKITTKLDDLKAQIGLGEANQAFGEGNLRRQHYYQHAYFDKLSDLAEDQLGWIRVARGRVRSGFANASCALAASRQVARAYYVQQMDAVSTEWEHECSKEVLNYESQLKAMRDQMRDIKEGLGKSCIAQALGLCRTSTEPVEPVFPTGSDVERCFRETLERRSTSAANHGEETMRTEFQKALTAARQMQCLPDGFDKQDDPDELDISARAPCTSSVGVEGADELVRRAVHNQVQRR